MKNLVKAEIQNVPLIQKLAKKSWNAAYKGIISQEQIDFMLENMYSEQALAKHFQNQNYHYFIINYDEKAVGFIGYEHHFESETTKLHRIYLIPQAIGHGLGKMAIDFIKAQVENSDDNRIILNVNKINTAKKVYESQGFRVFASAVVEIGNGFVMDDYLMEYIL